MAVINDTYAEIKAEESARPDEDFPIGMWMESKFENFQSSLTRIFSFCIEDNTPIWEALDHVHFLDDRIEWAKFRRRLLGEGADLDEIVEVFENFDTDRDFAISQNEYQRMIAHVTTHHTLDNPVVNRVETEEIKIGKKRGFVARFDFNDVVERLESIDEHIPEIESQLMQIETQLKKLNKLKVEQTSVPTKTKAVKDKPPPAPPTKTPVAVKTIESRAPPPPPPPPEKKQATPPKKQTTSTRPSAPPPQPPPTEKKTATPAKNENTPTRPGAPPPPQPQQSTTPGPAKTTTTPKSKTGGGDETSNKKPSKSDQNKQEEKKDTKSKTPNPRSGQNVDERNTSDDDTYYDQSDYYYYVSD